MTGFYVGPIHLSMFGNPNFAPASDGTDETTHFAGIAAKGDGEQLKELVTNPHRRITVGRWSGVLEPIWAETKREMNGWYLLTGATFGRAHVEQLLDWMSFEITAVRLWSVRPIIVHSSRKIVNDFDVDGVAVVAQPLWGVDAEGEPFQTSPGGTVFARDYDPRTAIALTDPSANRKLRLHANPTKDTAFPSVAFDGDPPNWIVQRGQDVRVYDRRLDRLVWGPGHHFLQTSDVLATNGEWRFWVGASLGPPYVHVQAFRDGGWHDVGVVSFEQSATDQLHGVRLIRCTPDVVTVALDVRDHGSVLVTLRRGERMLRAQHGTELAPQSLGGHYIRWRGLPPTLLLDGTPSSAAAKFGNGIDVDGSLRFPWPAALPTTAWSIARVWKPDAASAAQPSSALFGVYDSTTEVGRIRFDASDKRIKWTLGATTVQSGVLAWSAGQFVAVVAAFDRERGMALTVKVHTNPAVTVPNVNALDPGTTDETYTSFDFAACGDGSSVWGSGADPWGSGTWGGGILANGLLDNAMLFEDGLTDAEAAALLNSETPLGGLPSPMGRLVWYLAGDARPIPLGSALTDGRRHETTLEGGVIRNPDGDGFTKAIALLDDEVLAIAPFAVGYSGAFLEAAAYLATTDSHDDLADQHSQYVVANSQETRVRS